MCGICGIISQERKIEKKALQRMLFSLKPRGPDDQGFLLRKNLALGSRRLSIIDLSQKGRQPLTNEQKNLWLIFNGEIYNFPQLRKSLVKKGHRFSSKTDSEVVLHLYEEHGLKCLEKLRGMFAFAIWDEKKGRLFAARDRLGIKPFYYYQKRGRFIFASEIKALLASGLIKGQLNPQAIAGFLSLGSVPAPLSIIKDIKSLNPGEYLIWRKGKIKTQSFWRLEFEPKKSLPEKETLANIRYLLEESVKIRLISDVPLGAFLSGGLDSTVIVSLARKFTKGKFKTFNITFPEVSFSEADYAKIVSQKYQTNHSQVEITGKDLLKNLDKIIEAMDQPTINGINTYFVSKITRESGITVALSGLGGDEIFGGYPSFRQIPRAYKILKKGQKIPSFLKKRLSQLATREKLKYLFCSEVTPENLYFVWRSLFLAPVLKKLLSPKYQNFPNPIQYLKTLPQKNTLVDQISALEIRNYLANQLLRDTDFMSMSHSLEVRVPFLDHKLLEFMAQVPARLKQKNIPKKLLVKALENELPEEIIKRPKKTFGFPLQIWLKRELAPILKGVFSKASLKRSGIFKHLEIQKLWQKFQADKLHWSRIWALAIMELWSKKHL